MKISKFSIKKFFTDNKEKIKEKLNNLKIYPVVLLAVILICIKRYINKYFPHCTMEQLLFFIKTPINGVDKNMFNIFIRKCVINPILYSIVICYFKEIISYIIYLLNKLKKYYVDNYKKLILYISVITSLYILFSSVSFSKLYSLLFPKTSDFYERYYITPLKENIQFSKKKNLIFINVESLEKSFGDTNFYKSSLLEPLENFEKDGVQFDNYKNGFYASFTGGSIISAFSGVPANFISSTFLNAFGDSLLILKNSLTLGDILYANGYNSYAIMGTNSKFQAKSFFFKGHNIKNITDWLTIEKEYPELKISGSWGYGDKDIFEITKDKISSVDKTKPYFFYILTVDTHSNYLPKVNAKNKFDNEYMNVVYKSNEEVANFISWLQKQPDYKNTVVIVAGDHIRMGKDFKTPKKRSIYNLFLNTDKPKNINRTFTAIDMFPTIIEAIGGKIKNHKLGLGVSLFGEGKTLSEKFSEEYLNEELAKKNKLYESLWK